MTPEELSELQDLKTRVRVLEIQMTETSNKLTENTALTQEGIKLSKAVKEDTESIVQFSRDAQGAVNTLNVILRILRPFGYLGVFITAVYGAGLAVKAWAIYAIQHGAK